MIKQTLGSLFLSVLLIVCGCARQRIAAEKPTLPERKGVYHVAERHQTLFRICKTYGVDINRVASLNGVLTRQDRAADLHQGKASVEE
jgi:hypothetical protein